MHMSCVLWLAAPTAGLSYLEKDKFQGLTITSLHQRRWAEAAAAAPSIKAQPERNLLQAYNWEQRSAVI